MRLPCLLPPVPLSSLNLLFLSAHCGRGGRWRPVPCLTWFLPGGFPSYSIHWVQWCSGNVPLLCQQVQLLADHGGAGAAVCQCSSVRDSESRAASDSRQPLPGVHEELVVTEMQLWEKSLLPQVRHHWLEEDKFTTLICVFDGWIRTVSTLQKSSFKSRSLCTEEKKTRVLKPFFKWNMVLCFYFNVFFSLLYGYLRKSQWVSYSDWRAAATSYHSVWGTSSCNPERLCQSYAELVSLQTVFGLGWGSGDSFFCEIQNYLKFISICWVTQKHYVKHYVLMVDTGFS